MKSPIRVGTISGVLRRLQFGGKTTILPSKATHNRGLDFVCFRFNFNVGSSMRFGVTLSLRIYVLDFLIRTPYS